jgi:hypothetical protein
MMKQISEACLLYILMFIMHNFGHLYIREEYIRIIFLGLISTLFCACLKARSRFQSTSVKFISVWFSRCKMEENIGSQDE